MSLRAKLIYYLRQFPYVYPARIINSCSQWIKQQGAKKGDYYRQRGPWFKDIFDEGFLHHPAPQTLGTPNAKAFYHNSDYRTDKATLFYLQNSYLLGHKGLVLNIWHQVFQQFSHHFGISTLKKFFRQNPFYLFSTDYKRIQGVGAVLVSPESHNYYHWLSDVLPRIRLYESVMDKVDHFCISSKVPQKFLDVLPAFGIPLNKILLIGPAEKLYFDHLYAATLPGSEGRSPNWAVQYLRHTLINDQTEVKAHKKIYFKRGTLTGRCLINEAEIIALLEKQGFDIIEPDTLSIPQQVELMQQTRLVVSAHGAALSNLLFVPTGTAVIEIFSPDYFRTDCFYTLAGMLSLQYYYLQANKPAGAAWGDSMVDTGILLKTINTIEQ